MDLLQKFFHLIFSDIGALIKIILADGVLSVDNAIVIAMVCAGVKPDHQGTALKWGMGVAVIARIVLLLLAFVLATIPLLKLIAGVWLLKLGYDMLKGEDEDDEVKPATTLKGAIWAVALADVAMSLDNVLAVTGASGDGSEVLYQHTLFGYNLVITDAYPLAVFGVLISIPILLFASKGLMKLIDKYPVINVLGSILIMYVGWDMMLKDHFVEPYVSLVTNGGEMVTNFIAIGFAICTYLAIRIKLNKL